MEDKRLIKIIDTINGVVYELTTQDELTTYLNDIIQELTIETYYNETIDETMTYYKPITTIRNDFTIEENKDYQTIIKIFGEDFPRVKNPYSIW